MDKTVRQIHLWAMPLVFCCLVASHAGASMRFRAPLSAMINRAESIAIVRIKSMAVIKYPKNMQLYGFVPTHTALLTIEHTLRGSFAKVVRAKIEINKYTNPSGKQGSLALLFVGQMFPSHKGALPLPPGTVRVFGSEEGFIVIDDLGGLAKSKDRAAALSAIRSSIKNFIPEKGKKTHVLFDPFLNDAAAKPFLDLLKSKSSALRNWAMGRGLQYVHMTPYVATNFIDLLGDKDLALARQAAEYLMWRRCSRAALSLRQFAATDDKLGHKILCYLQATAIEESMASFDKETMARILALIPQDLVSRLDYSAELLCTKTKDDVLSSRMSNPKLKVLGSTIVSELEKMDWKKLAIRPFHFQVRIWRKDNKPCFRVTESDNEIRVRNR